MEIYDCASGRQCVGWVKKYLRECVCGLRDYLSVGFGLISMFSFAVGEVPQIITNFKNGSTEGLSLGFLVTRLIGDFFNLIGCCLDEGTVYTTTTTVLVCQFVFYDHICKWWRKRKAKAQSDVVSSLEEEELLGNLTSPSPKHSMTILCSVASILFFIGGMGYVKAPTSIPLSSQSDMGSDVILSGRKLFQPMRGNACGSSMTNENAPDHLGVWLGWLMAALYMGARLPQIILNIKRGTAEGVNPLMFLFSIIANAAYTASIIVKTLEWEKLKPDMPWLLDAGACLLLDFFILAQFVYYMIRKNNEEQNGDYEAAH